MIPLKIKMDGEGAWPDLQKGDYTVGEFTEVTILDHGMASGKPSVAVRIEMPDGHVVIAQTSARLFCSAAKAFMAKYPDLFKDN